MTAAGAKRWRMVSVTLLASALGIAAMVMDALVLGISKGLVGGLTKRYNRVTKYVASRALKKLDWKNSQLLGEDVPGAARRLRTDVNGEIRIWGSTQLIKTLAEHDLVDEYRLAVYPIVLGTGKKLFSDGFTLSKFALAASRVLKSGVVVNTYRKSG